MSRIQEMADRFEASDDLVFETGTDFDLRDLAFVLNDREHHAAIIDRAPVFNKETLLHALYQSLRFPGYFGFTWDALEDMLVSLKGEPGHGFALLFHDLSQLPGEDRAEFTEAIGDANEVRERANLPRIRVMTLRA